MSKHLQRDLEQLQREIVGFASMVEDAISKSVQSLSDRDQKLAEEVIHGDEQIDAMENHVLEDCLKILALHQPVATDLRRITSIFMITTDLERMGDLARHIAEVAISVKSASMEIPPKMLHMADLCTSMVRQALDSYVNLDQQLARRVVRMDDEADRYNDDMIVELMRLMKQSPDHIEPGMQLFAATRNLERIADHATNIAEDVIYLVEGEIVKHRPDAIGKD